MLLIRNAIRTPDGTILESFSRHDYRTHQDSITNREYMIDGGLDYCRRSNWGDEEDLCIYYKNSTHEQRAKYLMWGTYGKSGKGPFRRIAIQDMTKEHLQNCLDNCPNMHPMYRETMAVELQKSFG